MGKSRVVVSRDEFLLPKMEFLQMGEMPDGTPKGFYFKELGGEALLEFKSIIDELKQRVGEGGELKPYQAVELMARFIVLSACDETGRTIFTIEDLPMLKEKNPNLLIEMANTAMPLSGMSATSLSEVAVDLPNDPPSSSTTD